MSTKHWFEFDGKQSLDFEVCITGVRVDDSPERDVAFYSVAGRNGDVVYDQQRFANVNVIYSVAIYKNVYANLTRLKVALLSGTGYRKLRDTIHPDEYRMAVLYNAFSVETPKYNGPAVFDIVFSCKPQRFLFSGQEPVSFNSPGELQNDYFPALPLITVYGSGDGTVSVGDTVVKIIGQTDTIVLDCDLQNAYHETGEGVKENRNGYISAPTFPKLLPGINTIGWTGGVERLEIIPRWWTI